MSIKFNNTSININENIIQHRGITIPKKYDVIIIGSGAAAQTIVYDLKSSGKHTALIEKGEIGGTCALRGCIPKKVLVGAAEITNRVKDLQEHGISYESFHIDWSDLIKFKKTFTDPKPKNFKKSFIDAGVALYSGTASFTGPHSLKVDDHELIADNIVIATGAKPRPLQLAGEEHVITSEQFLELPSLPKSIVFIGGGYISFEFAHIAARAGATVTIIHRSDQPLKQFDPDLVNLLMNASKEIGINLLLNEPVKEIRKKNDHYEVRTTGEQELFEADLVVHGAGRIPDIYDLQLEKADISYNNHGIEVNDYMQNPANPAVFAAGDAAAAHLPLTPVAGAEGLTVLHNLLHTEKEKASISSIPSVVFTIPPLAMVGLTESQAKKNNLSYEINYKDTSSWFSSKRIGLKHSGFKLIIDTKNQHILGAHLFGHHAEELINLFAVFIKKKTPLDEIKEFIWSYPSSTYELNYML